jgi:hypothetical protein
MAPPVASASPRTVKRGKNIIVAVFDVEDAAGRFDEKVLNQLTEYLTAQMNEQGGYRVVPRNKLRTSCSENSRMEGMETIAKRLRGR